MRSLVLGLAAIGLVSCATSRSPLDPDALDTTHTPGPSTAAEPAAAVAAPAQGDPEAAANAKVEAAYAVAEQPGRTFDPKAYASSFPRPIDCEAGARRLQAKNPDAAWSVLKVCIDRKEFTLIKKVLDGGWDADLQKRPDAATALAKLVANRGGDVEGDLAMFRQRRIPLFSLSAAIAQPDTYKGRLVMLRGQVTDLKSQGGKPTVMLAQMGFQVSTTEVQDGKAFARQTKGNAAYGGGAYDGETKWSETRQLHQNVAEATGVEALGRLSKPDPFLEPGKHFVILGRFDGVRVTANEGGEEDETTLAVVSIIGYHEPAALLIE